MIKRVSFFKIIVSTFILILLLNNFSTIVVYASTEDISEDENNIEMISENKNTEENNEEIIGVKEEVEKNITEEVIQKDEDIEKDDVEIISKDIPKDQEENKEIINKEEIENNNETKYKEEIPQCVQDFLNNVSKIPTNITTENAEQVAELLYGICSDTYEELLNTEYINREDVKKAIITYSKSIENVEELLDQGKTVLYQTSPVMLDEIIKSKFEKNSSDILEHILNVDLLIIDDLGTETMNTMKFTELFTIINTRLLNQSSKITKTIISTNMDLKDIFTIYNERIGSRLVGNYNICRFFGDDIRLKSKK